MPEQMQQVKRRMKSIGSTEKITSAMKLVSSAKLKQATTLRNFTEREISPLADSLCSILLSDPSAPAVYRDVTEDGFPLSGQAVRPNGNGAGVSEGSRKSVTIVTAGSSGLCGSYNADICSFAEKNADGDVLPLGTFAYRWAVKSGRTVIDDKALQTPSDEIPFTELERIAHRLTDDYRNGVYTSISVIYARYRNSISMEPAEAVIFPLSGEPEDPGFLEYDRYEGFFDDIAAEYAALRLRSLIAESSMCEHAARRMAMKNASDNAKDMLTELETEYNRARQAAITAEIIEIIAGSESQQLVRKYEGKQ